MFNPFSGLEGTLNQNRGVPPYEYDVSEFAHTRKLNYIIPRMEVNYLVGIEDGRTRMKT